MKFAVIISLFCICCLSLGANAGEQMKPVKMPKNFETMKKLVGDWEGTSDMHGKEAKVTTSYSLTSGGTVIMEKLGAGTDHEMVSMIHNDGDKLALTHYCSMGNAPKMSLKKADDKEIVFEMTKPSGVKSMSEPHMHKVTLTMPDENTLHQEWVSMAGGKKESGVFKYTRKK
jgi:hypothetical protein